MTVLKMTKNTCYFYFIHVYVSNLREKVRLLKIQFCYILHSAHRVKNF